MSKHDDRVYLEHILESIQKAEKYLNGYTFAEFEKDDRTIDAIIRNFEIIGEASNNISIHFKESHPEIDFRSATSMRNRLAHGYDDIDLQTVWGTVKEDLPVLRRDIENLNVLN